MLPEISPPCSADSGLFHRRAAFGLQKHEIKVRCRQVGGPSSTFALLQPKAVTNQVSIEFPLTLTLSPEERE
jgi:hypothetical protein